MEITSLIMENHGKIMELCFLISVGTLVNAPLSKKFALSQRSLSCRISAVNRFEENLFLMNAKDKEQTTYFGYSKEPSH